MPALSYTTALGGGIIRDLLIGVTPPATFTDSRYLIVPAVCGVLTFYVHPALSRVRRPLMVFDAAGLGLFAVAGAQKSIDAGLNMPSSIGVGMITAVGGGIMRDVLVREVPLVLHREIYATAALIGATIVAVGDRVSWAPTPVAVAGVLATFAIRVISKWRGWSAPIAQER